MSDPVTSGDQSETSSASSMNARAMSRVRVVLEGLPVVAGAGIGVIFGIGIGNLPGWVWVLAGAGVLAASWLLSYALLPTPRSARIATRLQPVATKIRIGAVRLWVRTIVFLVYLLALMAPFTTGLRMLEVDSPLFVQILIIIVLTVVNFLLLFPLVAPKRRALLVWRFTQGRGTAKLLFTLGFGLIVSTSIALWDQLLLLLVRYDVVWLYLALPNADTAAVDRASLTDLINGNHVFRLLVWQLGDMVPTLKVNETIGFEQPLFYTSSLAGWLVLAFKTIVGLALLGSVVAIVQAQRARPDKPPDVSLLPRAIQKMLPKPPRARRPGAAAQTAVDS